MRDENNDDDSEDDDDSEIPRHRVTVTSIVRNGEPLPMREAREHSPSSSVMSFEEGQEAASASFAPARLVLDQEF